MVHDGTSQVLDAPGLHHCPQAGRGRQEAKELDAGG